MDVPSYLLPAASLDHLKRENFGLSFGQRSRLHAQNAFFLGHGSSRLCQPLRPVSTGRGDTASLPEPSAILRGLWRTTDSGEAADVAAYKHARDAKRRWKASALSSAFCKPKVQSWNSDFAILRAAIGDRGSSFATHRPQLCALRSTGSFAVRIFWPYGLEARWETGGPHAVRCRCWIRLVGRASACGSLT